MSSAEFRRGYAAGKHDGWTEAQRRYVLFDGVRAPGRDVYVVRYDADKKPWTALLTYEVDLSRALSVAQERIEQTEAALIRAYEAEATAELDAEEKADERRRAGGVRRVAAGLLHVVDSRVAHAKAQRHEAQRDFDRWCSQATLLRNELDLAQDVIEQMAAAVRSARHDGQGR